MSFKQFAISAILFFAFGIVCGAVIENNLSKPSKSTKIEPKIGNRCLVGYITVHEARVIDSRIVLINEYRVYLVKKL